MPVMDGPTATKEIRDLGYRGLIIGVTGNVLPEDKAFYISKGADAVLTKPLDVAQLAFALSPLYHACAFTEEDESKDDDLQEQQGDNSSPTAKAAALAPLRNKFWEHSSSFSEKPQSSQQPPTVPNREITAASAPISTHQSFSLSPEHMRRTSESAAAPAFEDFRRFFTGGKSASTSQKRGRLTPRQDKDSPDKISAAADGKSKKSANKGAGEASKKSPRGRNSLQCRPVSPKPSRRSRDSYDSWSRNSEGNNKSMFLGNLVAGAMTGSDPPGLKEAVLGEEKDSLSKGPQQASGSGSGSNQSNNVGGGIVGRVLEIGQGVMRTLSRSGSARNIDAMDDYSSKRTACELLKDVDHHEDDETVLAAKEDMMVMAGGPSRAVLTTVPAEAKPTGFIRRIASYFRNLASIAEPRSHGASPLPVVNINPVAATTTAAAQQGNRLLPRLRVSPVSPAISTPSSGMSASGDTPWFNFESPISRLKGGNSPKARVHPLKTDR
jgi:CheY-like chemotaxis protein